ncbi:MAG TPA: serine/threonine-protein kinase [Polyangiaceae bacterium]|nr:serine/threonine-protein kinase [Polyangiaceae bacterium]
MNGNASIPIGSMLAARWIVGGPLGAGENGEVYEAEEAQGGRMCAVKVLSPELRRGGPAWSTFQTEVRTVSALPADAVARIYDLGIDGKLHRAFVVCERVMFPSLARQVAERGPVHPQHLQHALATIAHALDAMHGAGVAHGSLKPQNVFVSSDNASWARLTDYGLARLRAAIDPKRGPTLGWSAPEHAQGGAPQPSGDLFTLGLVTFYAITGMPWLSALETRGSAREADFGVINTSASARARELGGRLDSAFDAWFKAALGRDPASRFSSAAEMARGFSAIVDSLDVSSDGPLSGPGVATAIARPLLFLRDFPQQAPAQPMAEAAPAEAAAPGSESQPQSSVAHPFSPTMPMPAMYPPGALGQPGAMRNAAAAGSADTVPTYAAIAPAPYGAELAQPANAAMQYSPSQYPPSQYPPSPFSVPAQANAGVTVPPRRGQGLLIAAALSGTVLLIGALVAGAVIVFNHYRGASSAGSASASAPKSAPESAAAASPGPIVTPVAPPSAAPAKPAAAPEPEPQPKPKVEPLAIPIPTPKPVAATPKPVAATPKPVSAKPTAAPAPKPASTPTARPTTARPTSKKCGTFINPCK